PPRPHSTLSLHDALPISPVQTVSLRKTLSVGRRATELLNEGPLVAVPDFTGLAVRTAAEKCETVGLELVVAGSGLGHKQKPAPRSEEHTSELQSRFDLVC